MSRRRTFHGGRRRRIPSTKTMAAYRRAHDNQKLAEGWLKEGKILVVSGRTVEGELEFYVHHGTAKTLVRFNVAVYCDVFGDPLSPASKATRCIKLKEKS